jgi:hypothetical protein
MDCGDASVFDDDLTQGPNRHRANTQHLQHATSQRVSESDQLNLAVSTRTITGIFPAARIVGLEAVFPR